MRTLYSLFLALILLLVSSFSGFGQVNFTDFGPTFNLTHTMGDTYLGAGVSFADFNGDGLDDISANSSQGLQMSFYQNTGSGFSLVSPPFVEDTLETRSVLWADYDNDGDKDLFLGYAYIGLKLFENDGSLNFTEITTAGFHTDLFNVYGISAADVDNDGYLDVYVSCWTDKNKLYKNNGDGTFSDITISAGVEDVDEAASLCSGFFDYNRDGAIDLFIANDKLDPNQLFENSGDGTFTDVSVAANVNIIMDAMSVTIGDFDNDLDEDIYISNTNPGNVLMQDDGTGTFYNVAAPYGVTYELVAWSANFFDFDLDADLDLYVSGSELSCILTYPSVLYINEGSSFASTVFTGDNTCSFSNAIGDFNNDGLMDIVVNNASPYPMNLWSYNTISGSWLKVALEGTSSNRDGIGARVLTYAGGLPQVRTLQCGTGYLGQSASYVHFGLASNTSLDSMVIYWPSGLTETYYDICVNKKLELIEGDPSSAYPDIGYDGTRLFINGSWASLQWNLNGLAVPGAIGDSHLPLGDGIYTVSLGDENGCVTLSNPFIYPETTIECNASSIVGGLDATSNLSGSNVYLSWDVLPGADLYQVKGRRQGTIPFGSFVTSNTFKNVGGLLPSAYYEYKVRARCEETLEVTGFSPLHVFKMNTPALRSGEQWQNMEIFPNPTDNYCFLSLGDDWNMIKEYSITDLSGKVHLRGFVDNDIIKIDLRSLSPGLFYITLLQKESTGPIHTFSLTVN